MEGSGYCRAESKSYCGRGCQTAREDGAQRGGSSNENLVALKNGCPAPNAKWVKRPTPISAKEKLDFTKDPMSSPALISRTVATARQSQRQEWAAWRPVEVKKLVEEAGR